MLFSQGIGGALLYGQRYWDSYLCPFFSLSLASLVLSNIRSGKVVFSARICYSYNMISYFQEGVHYGCKSKASDGN